MRSIPLRDPERRSAGTRTCIGCGRRDVAGALARLVVSRPDGADPRAVAAGSGAEVVFDLAGGSPGRGARVHPRAACLSRAPRSLSRALRCRLAVDAAELARQLLAASDLRMAALLVAANRIGSVAVGQSASLEALRRGAPLAIVAVDAGAPASSPEVAGAIAGGRAIAWRRKSELGALLGDESVAICAVRHRAIAAELKKARVLADAGAAAIGACSAGVPSDSRLGRPSGAYETYDERDRPTRRIARQAEQPPLREGSECSSSPEAR